MMTTFCALLGALPIAIGTGASSELRQPLGIAVVGGLIVSRVLDLFMTPVASSRSKDYPAHLNHCCPTAAGAEALDRQEHLR